MKIELKNFKHSVSRSRETMAFEASIVVDSFAVGTVSNDGGGGSNRTWFNLAELGDEVRDFIESLPADPRWPSMPMNADLYFTLLADAIVTAEETKKQARKDLEFAAVAHAKGHRAFRVTWMDDRGGMLVALLESKELLTVPMFVTRLRSPRPISNVTIEELQKAKAELTFDEARGVMKMSQVMRAKGRLERLEIERDVAFDWLLSRGYVAVVTRSVGGVEMPMAYASSQGRAWFHTTPGAGVAMLIVVRAAKASAA